MQREALADRIVNYCDALVAFSLVNGIAFLVALAEPDVRCSIVGIAGFMVTINAIFPIVSSIGLLLLQRAERRFRKGEEMDDDARRFWRGLAVTRFVLIWAFAALVLTGIIGATQDSTCRDTPSVASTTAP